MNITDFMTYGRRTSTMKPHNNKREGLKTSQSNTDNTMNQTLNLITKNKFLKEFQKILKKVFLKVTYGKM